MRSAIFAFLLVSAYTAYPQSADATLARLKQAQMYSAEGFRPIFCFAGQVKAHGKRLSRQPFSVFAADQDKKCCGELIKNARTDQHGHFVVEPLSQGRYFAKFSFGGSEEPVRFAIVDAYQECGSSHLEINFSKAGEGRIQEYIDINDSGEPCLEYQPQCYRK